MKKSLMILALVFSSITWMACPPKSSEAFYMFSTSLQDSVCVDWSAQGSGMHRIWKGNNSGAPELFATQLLEEGLPADAPLPSAFFDSLAVYKVSQGQFELLLSGVDDDDWTTVSSGPDSYSFELVIQ